ncbi:MAG: TIGR01212 family radical SAM protein [Bacteriovoracia bacterium]
MEPLFLSTKEEPTQELRTTNPYWFSYSDYLYQTFGEKVYKVTVSAGFTCPTRDGTKGTEGCAFCDERGSSSFFAAGKASKNIRDQIEQSIPIISRRFGATKFLAYFQAYTNTYGPTSYLQEVYDSSLNIPEVAGLAIGTRPDCIPNNILALLNDYGASRYVSLELGLQSFREESLLFYNRGHSVVEGVEGIKRALRFPNLNVSVHLMFGAPGETVEDAISSAKKINELGVHGVKIHQLMILKETTLAKRFAISPWPLLTMEEYNEWAMVFLQHLNPKIHVERTHALSSHPLELVGPTWSARRFEPINALKHLMKTHCAKQGQHFHVH